MDGSQTTNKFVRLATLNLNDYLASLIYVASGIFEINQRQPL